MPDIMKSAIAGTIIGVAAWAVTYLAGGALGGLGQLAGIATVAIGYVAVDAIGVI